MPYKILLLIFTMQVMIFSSLFSQTNEQIRANLYEADVNSTFALDDGNLTMYDVAFSNAIDGMDAQKMSNFGVNFGLARGNKTLAIERRQHITSSDTIFFKMWNMRQKNYKLDLILTGMGFGLSGVLEDSYLNTQTVLNLNGTNSVPFTVDSHAGSYAQNRFRVIFSFPASSYKLLPVTFSSIKAFQQNDFAGVEWTVQNEKDIARYQVEKSVNGQHFSVVSTITSRNKNSNTYKFIDTSAVSGNNFYRIAGVDLDGKIKYSNITKVSLGATNRGYTVFPNPVVGNAVNVQMINQPKGNYAVRIISNFGQVVYQTKFTHGGGSSTQSLPVSNILKGNYILEIIPSTGAVMSSKVSIQ